MEDFPIIFLSNKKYLPSTSSGCFNVCRSISLLNEKCSMNVKDNADAISLMSNKKLKKVRKMILSPMIQ